MAQVRLKAGGDVDDPESSLEAGDLEALGCELLVGMLLAGAAFVQLLTGVEGVAMDGGNEAVSDSLDGVIDVRMGVEEYLGCSRRYGGELLVEFVGGDGKAERRGFFSAGDDSSGQEGGGCFSEGREVLLFADKGGYAGVV